MQDGQIKSFDTLNLNTYNLATGIVDPVFVQFAVSEQEYLRLARQEENPNAHFRISNPDALLVPERALQQLLGETLVIVAQSDNTSAVRKITPGEKIFDAEKNATD